MSFGIAVFLPYLLIYFRWCHKHSILVFKSKMATSGVAGGIPIRNDQQEEDASELHFPKGLWIISRAVVLWPSSDVWIHFAFSLDPEIFMKTASIDAVNLVPGGGQEWCCRLCTSIDLAFLYVELDKLFLWSLTCALHQVTYIGNIVNCGSIEPFFVVFSLLDLWSPTIMHKLAPNTCAFNS